MKVLAVILFLLFAVTAGVFTGKKLFIKQKEELYNTKISVYHKLKIDNQRKIITDKAPPDRANPNGEIKKTYK